MEQPSTSDGARAVQPALLRALGPGTATAVVVGSVIGSGIFAKPGEIAAEVGDFRIIMAAWVIGGILCGLGAMCLAELATMLPHAGGLYVYLREAYGRPVAFLFGWCELLLVRPAGLGALAVIFVGAMFNALRYDPGLWGQTLLAAAIIAAVAWVNIRGVVWGGRLQNATTVVKVGALVLISLLPFLAGYWGFRGVDAANYASTVTPARLTLASQMGAALLAVMWAYNSWHVIAPVAEEIRHPHRNIPVALFCGVGILILVYVGANVAYHGVLSMSQMAASGQNTAEEVARALVGDRGAAVMSAVIMVSVFGTINAILLHAPRVAFAMGRDGVFFRQLGLVHAEYRTPVVAILVQATMAIVLLAASGALVAWSPRFADRSVFSMLTNYAVFSAGIFYVLGVAAVVVLRRKQPDWPRPFRTLGFPLVPLVFVAAYLWFLSRVYLDRPWEAHVGIGLIAVGIPVYLVWQRLDSQRLPTQSSPPARPAAQDSIH